MAGVKGQRSGGHNRKSAEEHALAGTTSRTPEVRNPEPTIGVPKPPMPLKGDAKREWSRMVALLRDSELLTVVDGAMLYAYCQLHGEAEANQREIESMRRRVNRRSTSAAEQTELRKLILRAQGQGLRHRQNIRLHLIEFGLSPASRSRVRLSPAGAGTAVQSDAMTEFDTPPPLTLVQGGR